MLIWRFYIKDIIFESVSKAWHTGKARLMGVWRLSRVELMLWVRGVTTVDPLMPFGGKDDILSETRLI
jgi:hypothetical protein